MKIVEINYINFRNLKDGNIKFSPKFNLFYGKNGQGKTSILEAIYFSATGKSFRSSKLLELIQYKKDKIGTYTLFEDSISEKSLSIKMDKRVKEYYYNKKKCTIEQFYGKINIVTFIPEDIELIMGSPTVRRTFFDAEISQANYEYFINLREYNKVLKIRNKYLKDGDINEELFQIYEDRFIILASKIIMKRMEYVKNISIILNLNYRKLFDDSKELSLSYESSIGEIQLKGLTLEKLEQQIRERLKKVRYQEKKYGFSMIGPQKDDFKFLLNEKEAKSFSSQGEKKSIIFSLKLSEIDMIYRERREMPIFIIDDISSYFDSIRKENIINYLHRRDLQVFISSTGDLKIDSRNFKIEEGELINDYDEGSR